MQLPSLDRPDALELVEIPAPVPAGDEVLIAVQAVPPAALSKSRRGPARA